MERAAPSPFPPAPSRRDVLRIGALSALGGFLPSVARTQEKTSGRVKTLIWIVPDGGESSIDTWDPKPEATAKARGPFRAIPTALRDGTVLSELYPRMARVLGKVSLVRTVETRGSLDHLSAMKAMLQRDGSKHIVSEHARAGTGCDAVYAEVPGLITGSDYRGEAYGARSLCMEMGWDADGKRFILPEMPPLDPGMPDRMRLLERMESRSPAIDDAFARNRERAVQILGRNRKPLSFHPKDIDAYGGENPLSIGILTIRELVHQGFSGAYVFRSGDFDDHYSLKDALGKRAPVMDAALSRMVQEIKDGDLGDALLVYAGEFGRSPVMNGSAGRDHYAFSSAFLCGNGIKEGYVHGDSGIQGNRPRDIVTQQEFGDAIRKALGMPLDAGRTARLPPVFA